MVFLSCSISMFHILSCVDCLLCWWEICWSFFMYTVCLLRVTLRQTDVSTSLNRFKPQVVISPLTARMRYSRLVIDPSTIATPFSLVVRWQTGSSTTWWYIFKPYPGGICRIFVHSPLCHTHNPCITYSYSDCGPVIEYNFTVAIVGLF